MVVKISRCTWVLMKALICHGVCPDAGRKGSGGVGRYGFNNCSRCLESRRAPFCFASLRKTSVSLVATIVNRILIAEG